MALSFITLTDLNSYLRPDERKAILDVTDDTITDYEPMELAAIEKIKASTAWRWDMTAEFAKTGASRSNLLMELVLDLSLLPLYQRVMPERIPQHRANAYDRAIEMLDKLVDPRKNMEPAWDRQTFDDDDDSGGDGEAISWGHSADKLPTADY